MPHVESVQKKILFTGAAFLLAFGLIAGAEYGLRLIGYGDSYPLFVKYDAAPEYLVANPQIIKRYLGKDYNNPHRLKINPVYFRADKPAGSYRIVVQGSSPAAGFPYGYFASLARQLERRAHRAFAGRPVEVVDTSITAVNSYVLLDLADEIIDIHPDAVLIYAGNNEYLGIMGVGSSMGFNAAFPPQWSHFVNRLFLSVKGVRLFQLSQDIHRLLAHRNGSDAEESDSGRSLMVSIAKQQDIIFGSDLYQLGLKQFESNLTALLEKYRRAGIRVYVGTIATNIHSLPPFSSKLSDGVDAGAWRERDQKALAAFTKNDFSLAIRLLQENIRSDPLNPAVWFKLGRAYEAQKKYRDALDAYVKAKDLDQLRFRAPEDISSIIRRIAPHFGATVVDIEKVFHDQAAHGLVGDDLMAEHVHPNAKGYVLLSGAFFDRMLDSHAFGDWQPNGPLQLPYSESPITEVDRYLGSLVIGALKSDFPFRPTMVEFHPEPPQTFVQKLATRVYYGEVTLTEATERQWEYYRSRGDVTNAAKILLNYADYFPYKANVQFMAGSQLVLLHRQAEALPYLRRAAHYDLDNLSYLLKLGEVLIATNNFREAGTVLDRITTIAPDNPTLKQLVTSLHETGAKPPSAP